MIRRLIILLLIVGCEEPKDCAGLAGGVASEDECGMCTGGTTGKVANYLKDCADECGGTSVEDECGVCDGDGSDDVGCGCFEAGPSGCDETCSSTLKNDACGICGGDGSTCDAGIPIFDIDGNEYYTVYIGEQLWMAENLKVTHYNNGDSISYPSNADFGSYDEGQYGVYDNDPSNADIYGNLYNWAVVDDERGVCPEGWHVPSDDEYTILTDYLGGTSVAGGEMKETGLEHWNSPNTGATNESGFTGLPAGYRNHIDGNYVSMGYSGHFWSSSANSLNAWYRVLYYGYSYVSRYNYSKQDGFSIRCLGD